MKLNPKTASKQWQRRLKKQGEVKAFLFEPYVKHLENGLVSNPITSAYPLDTPIFKTRQITSQFRRWKQTANRFFVGLSPETEPFARIN